MPTAILKLTSGSSIIKNKSQISYSIEQQANRPHISSFPYILIRIVNRLYKNSNHCSLSWPFDNTEHLWIKSFNLTSHFQNTRQSFPGTHSCLPTVTYVLWIFLTVLTMFLKSWLLNVVTVWILVSLFSRVVRAFLRPHSVPLSLSITFNKILSFFAILQWYEIDNYC